MTSVYKNQWHVFLSRIYFNVISSIGLQGESKGFWRQNFLIVDSSTTWNMDCGLRDNNFMAILLR